MANYDPAIHGNNVMVAQHSMTTGQMGWFCAAGATSALVSGNGGDCNDQYLIPAVGNTFVTSPSGPGAGLYGSGSGTGLVPVSIGFQP